MYLFLGKNLKKKSKILKMARVFWVILQAPPLPPAPLAAHCWLAAVWLLAAGWLVVAVVV